MDSPSEFLQLQLGGAQLKSLTGKILDGIFGGYLMGDWLLVVKRHRPSSDSIEKNAWLFG